MLRAYLKRNAFLLCVTLFFSLYRALSFSSESTVPVPGGDGMPPGHIWVRVHGRLDRRVCGVRECELRCLLRRFRRHLPFPGDGEYAECCSVGRSDSRKDVVSVSCRSTQLRPFDTRSLRSFLPTCLHCRSRQMLPPHTRATSNTPASRHLA